MLATRFGSRDLGRLGERRARWSYRLRGYSIVASNVRLGGGEIDLIARRGRTFVFAEVKTRQQKWRGAPHEAVDRKKQLQVARLAERWLREQRITPARVRFDVVSLYWNGWRFEVERFEDAYEIASDERYPWKWR